MRVLIIWAVVVLGSSTSSLTAKILDSAPNGFSLRTSVEISASPLTVYDTMIKEIGHWWDSDHTFSGSSTNLSLRDEPGGCFCESLGPDGGIRHGSVLFASRGKRLRLSGGLGPLQELAVIGTMTYELEPDENRTRLTMVYRVGGYDPEGLAPLAPLVDEVLRAQLMRLKSYIEKGTPDSQ